MLETSTATITQPSPAPPAHHDPAPISFGGIAVLVGAFVLVIIVISRTLNGLFKDEGPR